MYACLCRKDETSEKARLCSIQNRRERATIFHLISGNGMETAHGMRPSHGHEECNLPKEVRKTSATASVLASVFVCVLLVLDGSLVLYACLIWPRTEAVDSGRDPFFITGIITFVVCFTLPFLLIFGFMVRISTYVQQDFSRIFFLLLQNN